MKLKQVSNRSYRLLDSPGLDKNKIEKAKLRIFFITTRATISIYFLSQSPRVHFEQKVFHA